MKMVLPGALFVTGYVDELIICSTDRQKVMVCREGFKSCEADITSECSLQGVLPLRDLILSLKAVLYWRNGKLSTKRLLPSMSFHPKVLKVGIAYIFVIILNPSIPNVFE